ncbi:protein of unknown function [Candidatus Promineifilum breve]|uniref:Uncharacterized protein n=1 Tax=Candidatus Promineifilum breve TaxID=1806508 RepID=A0A161JMS7_9CHLR|nr:protein of unknown function [Candidatus Promineifilum breve]
MELPAPLLPAGGTGSSTYMEAGAAPNKLRFSEFQSNLFSISLLRDKLPQEKTQLCEN